MVATFEEHEQQENQDNLNEFSEEKDDAKLPVFIDTVGNNGDNDSRISGSETPAKEVVDNGIESEVVVGLPEEFQEGDMVDALSMVEQKSLENWKELDNESEDRKVERDAKREGEPTILATFGSDRVSSFAFSLKRASQRAKVMTNETNVTAPVNVTGAPVTNTVANHAEKPENSMGRILRGGNRRYFLCHNYVLNSLVDDLYNVYCKTTTAKELWESLERKYKTEDAGTKKFAVAHFLDYKMVDSKNVITQVQDLQILIHEIHAEGMTVSETFQVAAIIEKLPPSWVDFKNYLKHKRKEMSVEDLIVRLRIEEDNKLAQKNTYAPDSAKANMVEHAGLSSKSNSKAKGKGKKKNDKKGKGES
ncbi:hypothetical protein Tco_1204842 [Tanacetum coccineum]